MSQYSFSEDIWDYLGDMPDMPTRNDRDTLLQMARKYPRQEKRVHIWDYFFSINPTAVGFPQKREIEQLQKQKKLMILLLKLYSGQSSVLPRFSP